MDPEANPTVEQEDVAVREPETAPETGRPWWRFARLASGPVLALVTYTLTPASYQSVTGETVAFSAAGQATAAIAVWMAAWWLTEAIPIYATALLPLVLFPLTKVATMAATATPYANDTIFLFMGGFFLALAMERWGLHRRIALQALRMVGEKPSHMIGGFMGVAAVLSMWVSNTATTVMMLPVAMSVVGLVHSQAGGAWNEKARRGFAVALLLGVAYGASIGGMATPIGTPPNLFLISFAAMELGTDISFAQWMEIALPLCLAFFPVTWWLLTRVLFPVPAARLKGGRELVRAELAKLGGMSRPERIVLVVFLTACVMWITRPLLVDIEIAGVRPLGGLGDAGVAMLAAMVLFATPSGREGFTLDWETAVKLPWGILLLFGGGLSLAAAISTNGVGEWLGAQSASLAGLPAIYSMVAVVAGMVFLTELTSNTASAAALVPVFAAAATGLGASPLLLAVAATLSASCAFMLPVATPPNAVVFGSGHVQMRDMARAGLWLNFISIVLITALMFAVAGPVLGVR